MSAKLDDVITITNTEGEQFKLKVIGFFESGIAEIDKVQSYTSLATTQKILGKNSNYVSDIQIKLHNLNLAPAVAMAYAQFFELIVSGFGIYNILNMLIYEKMDTIAILKATGFAGTDIKKIFLTISLSIGVAGALAGIALGFLFSLGIDAIPFDTSSLPTVKTYPIDYGVHYYLIAVIFAIATTSLAGWLPARKASKVDPVEIIRGK